jgi:hypothetical protein
LTPTVAVDDIAPTCEFGVGGVGERRGGMEPLRYPLRYRSWGVQSRRFAPEELRLSADYEFGGGILRIGTGVSSLSM